MKKNKNTKEKVSTNKTTKTSFLESNWIVRITALVIIIPLVIVAFLLLTSIEGSGEPVVGNRFKNQLVNKIDDAKLEEVESALVYNNVESVSVSLKSATLRILIDTNNDISKDALKQLTLDAYKKVTAILPVKTYFTNLTGEDGETIKMYDLEINVYNLIPEEGETTKQLYAVRYKNASSDKSHFEWITSMKNKEVVESLMKD